MTTSPGAVLQPEDLIAASQEKTGFANFGDDDFREPLELLCRSLAEEAPVTPEGLEAHRLRLVGVLGDRLRLQAWFDRHPEIAQEDVGAPVFIVGLPRTGTTMLYRMLAAAAEGFAAPLFYEVSQSPPPLDWDFRKETDPRIPAAEAAVAGMMAAMPELASIYPFEAMAPEESIFMYTASLRSTSQQSNALVPAYDRWFRTCDKRPAYRYLKRAVQFLQWQRRRAGRFREGQRWLLKTPDHIHGVAALLDVFPGAQIIQTHRDPVQTIPSICSFIRVLHSPTVARDDAVDIGQAWSAMFAASMTEALAVRERAPSSFLDVWYRDTVADQRKVAEQVFAFIGQPLTEAGWAEMQKWREANKREERPLHHYTLEEFGLSEDQIKAQFADYRARFIVPTLQPQPAA